MILKFFFLLFKLTKKTNKHRTRLFFILNKLHYHHKILCSNDISKYLNVTLDNLNSGNVGTFFIFYKMKTKRLSNHISQYFIHYRT